MASSTSSPLSISDLLHYKAITPLDTAAQDVLVRTQSLDVSNYTEADVREEIISPLLKVLGYDKQSYFSVEREKPIQLLGRKNFLDYNLTLWSTNFWLIEAKKPGHNRTKFGIADNRQVVGYSVHPEINAALAVLCDGRKIAVFDREENQIEPILTVEIPHIQQEIDKLRAVLSPWQVWFFEKRRIIRHLDRVFDNEFNVGRLEEFKTLVMHRLDAKRGTVFANMRSVCTNSGDIDQTIERLRATEPADLIEGAFFLVWPEGPTTAIAETLVRHCQKSTFHALHRVFQDHPRDMNDHYCMHALNFLMHLHKANLKVDWLPEWLGGKYNLEGAIKLFTANCLTQFASDHVRRNILLSAAALRRLFKAMMVVNEATWRIGHVMHVLTRYEEPEDGWGQLLSSPESQNLEHLDKVANVSIAALVRESSDDRGQPRPLLIESRLREIWKAELAILEGVPSYRDLLRERRLGEVFPTEATDVKSDWLGHSALCVADRHPIWKRHILEHHGHEVETLAQIGSRKAQEWLGHEADHSYSRPTDRTMADRFFLGDVAVYRGLKVGYGYA